ncbi:AraC family transcriptional regulator [Lachnospiraceae bacterium OttesenSCG-928-E19]|nr:AraC family transcriptional regulator [Lachnospiraceae bacterium OttesenSCG-928-E19]
MEKKNKPSLVKQRVDYRLLHQDMVIDNHRYVDEYALFNLLRSGDVDGMEEKASVLWPVCPSVIEGNHKKSEEYLAVVCIAISTRTAIEAGATTEESFQLSDVCLKRIARCHTVAEIVAERSQALVAFTELVRDCKGRRQTNIYVEDAKKYIAANIFSKVSLADVASNLGINPTYLSRLFSDVTGMTFVEYIRQEKIKAGKELLQYSDKTIAEISEYLKFNSQSYFGKVFKEQEKVSPKEYRHLHHPPEY